MRASTIPSVPVRHQRGLAIVEFKIVMPLVLFVLIATAEIGRALYQYTALTKAVRDGARFLADQGDGSTGIPVLDNTDLTRARNLTVFGNINGTGTAILPGFVVGNVTAQRVTSGGTATEYVRVTATYNFQALFVPIPGLGMGTSNVNAVTTLTATATQRTLKV